MNPKCPLSFSFFYRFFQSPFFWIFYFSSFQDIDSYLFFAIKKGHLERFILNDLISHKRQEPCASYFFLPDFSETKFFYLFYRHKYKSQNHNNTRYSMRQQFIFCILCYNSFSVFCVINNMFFIFTTRVKFLPKVRLV